MGPWQPSHYWYNPSPLNLIKCSSRVWYQSVLRDCWKQERKRRWRGQHNEVSPPNKLMCGRECTQLGAFRLISSLTPPVVQVNHSVLVIQTVEQKSDWRDFSVGIAQTSSRVSYDSLCHLYSASVGSRLCCTSLRRCEPSCEHMFVILSRVTISSIVGKKSMKDLLPIVM